MYPLQGQTPNFNVHQPGRSAQTDAYQKLAVEMERLVELVRESQFNQHEFMTKSYELLREYGQDVEQVQREVRNFLEKAQYIGVRSQDVDQIIEKLDTIIVKLAAKEETALHSDSSIQYNPDHWPQGHSGYLSCKEFMTGSSTLAKESFTPPVSESTTQWVRESGTQNAENPGSLRESQTRSLWESRPQYKQESPTNMYESPSRRQSGEIQ